MKTKAERYVAARLRRPAARRAFRDGWNEMQLAARVAYLRQKRGLTQTQLAGKMGTSAAVISRIETGKFGSLRTLKRCADALGLALRVDFVPAKPHRKRPAKIAA